MQLILQPILDRTLGQFLNQTFHGDQQVYHSFFMAVAFAKHSGVQHIQAGLQRFADTGAAMRIVIGIDQLGTSFEGLSDLLSAIGNAGEIWINHDESDFVTFHPKIYLFEGEKTGLLIVGSGNLTQGGLYTNDEASVVYSLDLAIAEDRSALASVKAAMGQWCNGGSDTARRLDWQFLHALLDGGYIRMEADSRREDEADARSESREAAALLGTATHRSPLFGRAVSRRRPPRFRIIARRERRPSGTARAESREPRCFLMTLMRTDVGVGQTTPGTSRRSPEIFVPLTARNKYPEFWGWPNAFSEDPSRPGKFDRYGVQMRLGGGIVNVNMMTWPDKHDFRMRSESLRSAGHEGDIMRIERTSGTRGFDYYVEIIPQDTTEYEYYLGLCSNSTPHSRRRWGYYA